MSLADRMADELKAFLEEKIPKFLIEVSEEYGGNSPWEMPIVEDFVVVLAVKDYKDGDGSVFSFVSKDTPSYRVRGLLHEALD
jgi:hypothetical protein